MNSEADVQQPQVPESPPPECASIVLLPPQRWGDETFAAGCLELPADSAQAIAQHYGLQELVLLPDAPQPLLVVDANSTLVVDAQLRHFAAPAQQQPGGGLAFQLWGCTQHLQQHGVPPGAEVWLERGVPLRLPGAVLRPFAVLRWRQPPAAGQQLQANRAAGPSSSGQHAPQGPPAGLPAGPPAFGATSLQPARSRSRGGSTLLAGVPQQPLRGPDPKAPDLPPGRTSNSRALMQPTMLQLTASQMQNL
jgi:hypothetical protein